MMTSSTLFRNEAMALKQSLEIGSPLYSELEHALLVQNGLTTLSNGRKVYSKRAEDKLSGGMIASDDCDTTIAELFNDVINTVSDLHRVSKDEALKNCKSIRKSIGRLATINQLKLDSIALQQEKGEGLFIFAHNRRVECSEIIKNNSNKLSVLGKQLDELKSDPCATIEQIDSIERNLHFLFSSFSLSDVIRNVEECDANLNKERRRLAEIKNNLKNVRGIISDTNVIIAKKTMEIQTFDQKIKDLGKVVTKIKNIILSLKNLLINYKFLDTKIDLVKEAIEFDLNETLIKSFLCEIEDARKSSLAVNLALTM